MKKIINLLLVLIASLSLFLLTSCGNELETKEVFEQDFELIELAYAKEGEVLVGLLSTEDIEVDGLPSGTYYSLYQEGVVPAGEYAFIYISESKLNSGSYSYPTMEINGLKYSGVYNASGDRLAVNDSSSVVYVRMVSMVDALLMSIVCILIVFSVLVLLWGVVSLFKFFKNKDSAAFKETNVNIEDEDMMIATLIATIDYREELSKSVDIKVRSVKEIK